MKFSTGIIVLLIALAALTLAIMASAVWIAAGILAALVLWLNFGQPKEEPKEDEQNMP